VANLYALSHSHRPADVYTISNRDSHGYAPSADSDSHSGAITDHHPVSDLHAAANLYALSHTGGCANLHALSDACAQRYTIRNAHIHADAAADPYTDAGAIADAVPNLYRVSDAYALSHANQAAHVHPISNPDAGGCGQQRAGHGGAGYGCGCTAGTQRTGKKR